MTKEQFIEELKKINVDITEYQLKQLEQYYELLIEWNKKMNLTGITKKEDVYLKHFFDSATIAKIIDLNKIDNLCDVGTGAGFPGIVIKILFPKIHVTLVDSLNKRINFLNTVIKELELVNIVALHERAEIFALNQREKFQLVTARAVAPLNILSELCIPLVKIDGYFIPLKSNISQEIKGFNKVISKLGGENLEVLNFELPYENSNRTLLKVQKKNKTNQLYPRKYADIKRRPL